MAQSRGNVPSNEVCSPSIVGERVCAFLRGLHPQKTAARVTADVATWRVSFDTVRNMLERETAPGAVLWLALIDAYGPNFLAAALPKRLAWLDEAARAQRHVEIAGQIEALQAEMDRLVEGVQAKMERL